jgi:hypothetical protein
MQKSHRGDGGCEGCALIALHMKDLLTGECLTSSRNQVYLSGHSIRLKKKYLIQIKIKFYSFEPDCYKFKCFSNQRS